MTTIKASPSIDSIYLGTGRNEIKFTISCQQFYEEFVELQNWRNVLDTTRYYLGIFAQGVGEDEYDNYAKGIRLTKPVSGESKTYLKEVKEFLPADQVRAGGLYLDITDPAKKFQFSMEVDTSDVDFVQYVKHCREAADQKFYLESRRDKDIFTRFRVKDGKVFLIILVLSHVYAQNPHAGNHLNHQCWLKLEIPIGQLKEKDDLVLALDFGNSNSTVICARPADNSWQLTTPINKDSCVTFKRAAQDSDTAENQLAKIRTRPAGDLSSASYEMRFDSPKRLLGIGVQREIKVAPNQVDHLVPAEARIAELFQEVHKTQRGFPYAVIATYPTTYMTKEIEQLRRAILRAEVRSRALGSDWKEHERLIKPPKLTVIDEASASAFYFFNEIYYIQTARHPEYEFVYQDGITSLLIIDVGGGTTDVVIVECKAEKDKDGRVTIQIDPLHRTGVRDFGGDDITLGFFKLLKAKLAILSEEETPTGDERLEPPRRNQNFSDWYRENEPRIEEIIKTKFDPLNVDQERLARAYWIFKAAEFLKIKGVPIAGGNPDDQESQDRTAKSFAREFKDKINDSILTEDKAIDLFNDCVKDREWVGTLIEDQFKKCCDRINNLIAKYQEEKDRLPDHVFLVGSASQYKPFEEYLKKHLKFWLWDYESEDQNENDRLKMPAGMNTEFIHRVEVLKNAVVQGAFLARKFDGMVQDATIKWPKDLSEKMTSRIVWLEGTHESKKELIEIGEKLKDIDRKWILLTESMDAREDQQTSSLYREFEGENIDPADPHNKTFVEFVFPRIGDPQGFKEKRVYKVHVRYCLAPDDPTQDDWLEMTWDENIKAGETTDAERGKTAKGVIRLEVPPLPHFRRGVY